MPDARPRHARPHGARSFGAVLVAAVRSLLRRIYALAMILLIFYVSYRAVRYLVVSLVMPSQTPAQIAGVPKRMDEGLLRGTRPDWLGLTAVENPRSPLSHYHRFDTWIQSDRFNDCTRSGCHAPLPHSKRKEVRAFLNMHATTLHCGVCHIASDAKPLPVGWYDLATGRMSGPPELLAAYAWLEQRPTRDTAAPWSEVEQSEIVELLRKASAAGGESNLERAAQHLAAVRPSSRAFAEFIETARDAVPRALRGSYGKKLAQLDSSGKPRLGHPGTQAAVWAFLEQGATVDAARREVMVTAVHPLKRAEALTCSDCHREQGSLIDFARAGYSPGRQRRLFEPSVFRMIEHIARGQPFYLPGVGRPQEPSSEPTTQPVFPESRGAEQP